MEAILQTGMSSMAMREAYQRVAYYRAVELYHSSNWLKAKEFFNKSLTYQQNLTFVALAHFWMGELAYKKGDAQEALAQFESFLNTPGSYALSERPVSLYNKAYCLYKLDKLEDADSRSTLTRLLESPNAYLSPHVAGWTTESYIKLSSYLANKILNKTL